MKYSETAENKWFAEKSVSTNFKCIFHSDCISGSTLINMSLHTADLSVRADTDQSFAGCEEVRSPVTSSRCCLFPHQGSSKRLLSPSSYHNLLCAVYRGKLFSCTFSQDFQQSSGAMKSQPSGPQNQPSLVPGRPGSVSPTFLNFCCARELREEESLLPIDLKGLCSSLVAMLGAGLPLACVLHPQDLCGSPGAPCTMPKSWSLLPHNTKEPHMLPRPTHLHVEHGRADKYYSFLQRCLKMPPRKKQALQCFLQKDNFNCLLQQVRG